MNSPAADYKPIQDHATRAHASVVPAPRGHLFRPPPGQLLLLLSIGLTAILALTIHQALPHWQADWSKPNSPTHIPTHWLEALLTPLLHPSKAQNQAAQTPLAQRSASVNGAARPTSFYNYTMARVDIGKCTEQTELKCRALLHVERGPAGKVVYAGLMVYTDGMRVHRLNGETSRAIRSLAHGEAVRLSYTLVTEFARGYGMDFSCGARTDAIASAVLRAAPVVARCVHTRDPSCYDDFVVATC